MMRIDIVITPETLIWVKEFLGSRLSRAHLRMRALQLGCEWRRIEDPRYEHQVDGRNGPLTSPTSFRGSA